MKTKMNTVELVGLEARVIDLEKTLSDGIEPESSVPRDNAGTLHLNLLSLSRAADRTARELEGRYGLQRGKGAPQRFSDKAKAISGAANVQVVVEYLLDVIHDIGGSYFARRALFGTEKEPPRKLTKPLEESMQKKALTDQQIEDLTLDVWEAAVLRMREFEPEGQ